MKLQEGNIYSMRALERFVSAFTTNSMAMSFEDSQKLSFVGDFGRWLMGHKEFFLKGSFDTDKHMLILTGKKISNNNSPVIVMRYESGMKPIVYWVNADSKRVNEVFDGAYSDDLNAWYAEIYEKFCQ